MNPNKLPEGWILCQSKSNPGRKYYFNKKTGESSWVQSDVKNDHGDANLQTNTRTQINETQKKYSKKDRCENNTTSPENLGNEMPSCSMPIERRVPDRQSTGKSKTNPNISKGKAVTSPSQNDSVKSKIKKNKKPKKNIAHSRLLALQNHLQAELEHEEKLEARQKTQVKQIPPQEVRMVNKNNENSQITFSMKNDSAPKESKFYRANKIISSMKAHLADKYGVDNKPKELYKELEDSISNQNSDSTIKPSATPPQFFEAHKLLLAIKHKLTKSCLGNVSIFKSAKERMEALRNSYCDSSNNTDNSSLNNSSSNEIEAMQVDSCREANTSTSNKRDSMMPIKGDLVLVVDTNIFLHELEVIKNVLNSHIKGYSDKPNLLVPWKVINELDRLKDTKNNNWTISKRAKCAMDYLYKSLPENERIRGQSLRDANCHIYPCEVPDDEILNCCLQQVERGKSVILLSNDKNLCNKACINNVKSVSLGEVKELLVNKNSVDPQLRDTVEFYQTNMQQLLANILETEMRAKYNNLWQHVIFKAPPWTLSDVLQCLLKHWVAVFSDVFPRIEDLIKDLYKSLTAIEGKGAKSLSYYEAMNFIELCLEVAKKCRIIPDYMAEAKSTAERLANRVNEAAHKDEDDYVAVVNAFEAVWIVFSSYCAKLSTAFGVNHSLEDKLPSDDAPSSLVEKWPIMSRQTISFTSCLRDVLNAENEDILEEKIIALENVLNQSLTLLPLEMQCVDRSELKSFCVKCRNMLQQAHLKFTQVTELLELCKRNL